MEGALKPIIDLINESGDYNAVMERLIETYPDMDIKAIEDMLARAIFVSELWGRLNA
jgi:phage gp29-like protein